MTKPAPTNLKELTVLLVKIEHEWDESLLNDQEMDDRAAEAARAWARSTRRQILGGEP